MGDDGALMSLGIQYAQPGALTAPVAMAAPYSAERDAVSLSFLRRFYDGRVKPLEQAAGQAFSTDMVVKLVIMREAWDAAGGRARRMVELLEPSQRWAGPASGTDMYGRPRPWLPLLLVARGC